MAAHFNDAGPRHVAITATHSEGTSHAIADATHLPGLHIGRATLRRGAGLPEQANQIVVPFPAGGPADTIARVLGDKMSALLGQPVVIENRAGAGGLTGTGSVAKSDPDGHTIGIAASSALAINVNLARIECPFNRWKRFSPDHADRISA